MNLTPDNSKLLERIGAFVAIMVMLDMTWLVIAPSFGFPVTEDQIKTTVANVFIAVTSFFFGASVGTRKKDDTIQTLTTTAAKAQDALPAVPGTAPTIPVELGDKVTVEGVPKP
jgi:hypothetical protein